MKKGLFSLFIILTITFLFCDQPTSPPPGAFRYTSYDSSNVALVTGWFTMNFKDSTISGEWHFRAIGHPQNIGPQIGDGNLEGGVHNGQIWIELNPQYRDNNLSLFGTLEENRFAGQWAWISFIGPTNGGKFVAVKQ